MLKYSYKFDDNEWSPFQSSEVIPIFGLKTGKHIFSVRASDMDGNIDLTPATNIFYKIDPELGGKIQLCDSFACVRLYFPPRKLVAGREAATITHKKNYELKDSSFVIAAYDIIIHKTIKAPDKPVTLAISLLNKPYLNENELAIFQQNEKFDWSGIGGTISHINDSLTITTSVTGSGIYAVRKKSPNPDTLQTCKISVQPRIFSPTGNGQGHGNCVTISFSLQQNSVTTIKIYNIAGRLKRIIIDNVPLLLGINAIEWDGRDDDGNFCPTGLYIVTVEAEGNVQTKTVMVSNKYR